MIHGSGSLSKREIEGDNGRLPASIVAASWKNIFEEKIEPRLSGITIEASAFDMSGYAENTRTLLSGLIDHGVFPRLQPRWFKGAVDIRRKPLCRECPGDYLSIKTDDNEIFDYCLWIDRSLIEKLIPLTFNVAGSGNLIVHMAPYSYSTDHFKLAIDANPGFRKYIGSTMFETDRLSAGWVKSCNRMDQIWVPSTFNMETFAQSGVETRRLRKVPFGVDTKRCRPGRYPVVDKWAGRFVFLSVFEWEYRKGWDILLKSFCHAFDSKTPVVLLIRTNGPERKKAPDMIHDFLVENKIDTRDLPEIHLISDRLTSVDLCSLYETCDAFVLPSRGEGWGMPYLEAMAFGKPVIGTNWGGSTEFLTETNSYLIPIDGLEPVPQEQMANPCFEAGHFFASPSIDALVAILKDVFENQDKRERIAKKALNDVQSTWNQNGYTKSALRALDE